MKRRKSNLTNSEKLLQGMNATSSGARLMQRKGSVHACATILEFADEVNEENRGENRESTQSVEGGRRQECANESYGLKKPKTRTRPYCGILPSYRALLSIVNDHLGEVQRSEFDTVLEDTSLETELGRSDSTRA